MATLTTLVSFNSTDGQDPTGSLIADASGDLFGTTFSGGANGDGTVFEITNSASGYASTPTVLVSFNGLDGAGLEGSLITDAAGDLFGTTSSGGTYGHGTVFEIAKTASGYASSPTVLVSFNGTNGASPAGDLLADASGDLFGTTSAGGANADGTVFEIAKTASGYANTPTVLVSFNGADGASPVGSLIADKSGDLFGTTSAGGVYSDGTIFEIAETANGYASTPVVGSFDGTDGARPLGSLIVAPSGGLSGALIGTASAGETGVYSGDGTLFFDANLTKFYDDIPEELIGFNAVDGANPAGSLIYDSAGDLFGTTEAGGASGEGTVFELGVNGQTTSGYYYNTTVLASFDTTNGSAPTGSLISDASGDLFGTTTAGGANGDGTVFELTGVTPSVVCYCTGTRILTSCGEVAVEDLATGDLVVTSSGEHRPIRWLGHRTLDCRTHIRPEEAYPVRIARHAFGPNKPAQDLYVSRGHWICADVLGEVLISVNDLINGATISQVEVDQVTYWHVELESHDVLIANGLPAESYRDMGNRNFFVENGVVGFDMAPDADPSLRSEAPICRPFIDGGPVLDAVRHQLRRRAETLGWMLDTSEPLADLHLVVDGRRVDPVVRGLTARFAMPGGARDVWLVSTTARPIDVIHSDDVRHLGVFITGLTLYDGLGDPSVIEMDDPLLCDGFFGVEEGCRQWTAGRARLPATLWDGWTDEFFLRVDVDGPALPRWKKLARLVAEPSERVQPSVLRTA